MSDSSFVSIIKTQWKLMRIYWPLIILIYVLSFASVVISVILAYLNREVVDNVFIALDIHRLNAMLPIIITVFVIMMVTETSLS